MKFIIILLLIPNIAFAQYVARALQQRIQDDQNSINLDLADIALKNADIQNIVNDQQANEVTANVPEVQQIEASAQQDIVSAQKLNP